MLSAYVRPKSKQERLWDACCYGREETVRSLISGGANVNWKSHVYECGPIHIASQGKPVILKLLLEGGCFVDATDGARNTALHHASMVGHTENVMLLLDFGAAVDALNQNNWTPLHNSAYWNHPLVTSMLLSRGADPFRKNRDGRNCLHLLCRSKSRDSHGLVENLNVILNSMASKGSSEVSSCHPLQPTGQQSIIPCPFIDERCECTSEWDYETDFTPLLFACYHGHLALAEALLLRGANINATAQNGWTALHWAAQRCHADIVELLLDHGASRSMEDLRGDLPCDVTNDLGLRDCLLPDPVYPNIITNGYVTTDEEDETGSDVGDFASTRHSTSFDTFARLGPTNNFGCESADLVICPAHESSAIEFTPLDAELPTFISAHSECRKSTLCSPPTPTSPLS